ARLHRLTVLPASKGLGNSQVRKTPVLTGSPSTLQDHLRNLWQVLQFLIFSRQAAAAASVRTRYESPRASSAHITRAFLLARATAATLGPPLSLSRLSQMLRASRLRSATRAAARAPWMSSVRR